MESINYSDFKKGALIFFKTDNPAATQYQARILRTNEYEDKFTVKIILGGLLEYQGEEKEFEGKSITEMKIMPDI